MDTRYDQFCHADPAFYDLPFVAGATGEGFIDRRDVPTGWGVRVQDIWTVLVPAQVLLPEQGWKIHVSATPDNATTVLGTVWAYCVPANISFKVLTNQTTLLLRNAKYADRTGSGKFVTIYPVGLDQLERTLRELGAALEGSAGPYVLSDVRWGPGPLYVRYGGFIERHCRMDDGEISLAIADPDGRLVPDLREPRFTLPDWVAVPEFLAASVAARLRPDAGFQFPFQVERALHFSNGGGIYLAVDNRTGRRVVLREARPHAGLDADGNDAVRRLLRERDFLKKLAGSGVVPDLYEYFTCWEHHFLVEEYIEGDTLGRLFVMRYPLIHPEVPEEAIGEYTAWALDVLDKVRTGLSTLHNAGIAFGDLHPQNIIVTPSGSIRFVDLEMASYLVDKIPATLGAPGYTPVDGRTGAEADHYALASLSHYLFLPLNALFPLNPALPAMLASSATHLFPVPPDLLTEATARLRDRRTPTGASVELGPDQVARLTRDLDSGEIDWPALRDSICGAILASATPARSDRLFPGDIEQFTHGGTGLAYGAAGVLYALAVSGVGRFPEHEAWLLKAVRDPANIFPRTGFYDGLHGVAYALAEIGLDDDAISVLEQAMLTPLDELPNSLFSGMAGVGLNLLHFAALTADSALLAHAVDAGARLADATLCRRDPAPQPPTGLLLGYSGHALLYLRLFEVAGETEFLDFAEQALRRDIDECVVMEDGTLLTDEGWRAEPYIGTGSAGVGLVLQEFLRHRDDNELSVALARIRRACEPEFVMFPGLFAGRAGLMACMQWLADPEAARRVRAVIDRHLQRLAWHVVPYCGQVAFAGNQLLRLSMDLATGSAGVLLALSAVLDDGPSLPFLTGQ